MGCYVSFVLALVEKLMQPLLEELDVFTWNLIVSGISSVNSMYADCMNGHIRFLRGYL